MLHVYPEGLGVQNDLIKYKITNKPLRVLANGNINGIDTDYFNPILYSESDRNSLKDKLKIPYSHFVYIFVGRLVKDKGINELISAFSKLSKSNDTISLLLAVLLKMIWIHSHLKLCKS